MRTPKEIYEETQKEFLKENNQSLNNMALKSIEKAQKEMFYFLYTESEKDENKNLSMEEFFDKIDYKLNYLYHF